jgi:hypothetical protein
MMHQSEPENAFPADVLELKAKLTRSKSKGRKVALWFEEGEERKKKKLFCFDVFNTVGETGEV